MTRKRTDQNQQEIVNALRAIGASVAITSSLGHGFPDLVVGFRNVNYLLEVKVEKGTWTDDEVEWHMNWHGQVQVVKTPEGAIVIVTGKAG